MWQVRKVLDTSDNGWPNNHYHKVVHTIDESPNRQIVYYYGSLELKEPSVPLLMTSTQ